MGGRDIAQLPPERYRSEAMPLPSHVCRAGLSTHPGSDTNCVRPGTRLEEACKLQSARDRARCRCERVRRGSKHGRHLCAEYRVQGCRVCGKTMPPRLAYVCKDCSCRNSQDTDEQSLNRVAGKEGDVLLLYSLLYLSSWGLSKCIHFKGNTMGRTRREQECKRGSRMLS